jgi:hypothetical protein
MRPILPALAFVAAAMIAAPAFASDESDVVSHVEKMVAAWNKNDAATVAAGMTASPTIIDEYPPYHWQGPMALQAWNDDFAALAKKNGISDPVVTLAKPTYVVVRANSAYVVVPAAYRSKQDARTVQEKGILTVALERIGQSWLVMAFAWTRQ